MPDLLPGAKDRPSSAIKRFYPKLKEHIIIDYDCFIGNPSDDTLLEDTLVRSKKKLGRAPRAVATDRGFASQANDNMCAKLGIKKISIPRKGKLSKKRKDYQKQRWFKRLQKFRAGGEATISLLKKNTVLNERFLEAIAELKYGLDGQF